MSEMKPCIACGLEAVSIEDPPRYDVLREDAVIDETMQGLGPFCETCFAETVTFAASTNVPPDPVEPPTPVEPPA